MILVALLMSTYLCVVFEEARSQSEATGQDTSYRAALSSSSEPGEKMEMKGVILTADGKPLAGASVYAYHTDARGMYNQEGRGGSGNREPRLRGTMRTNSAGQFEFRSIKPGTYPSGGAAAHVHFEVTPPGGKVQYFEAVFRGEPHVTEEMAAESARGSAQRVVTLQRGADGVLRGNVELRLR
jgi:protocatechuate 3,4-dioxygenase beta subunit